MVLGMGSGIWSPNRNRQFLSEDILDIAGNSVAVVDEDQHVTVTNVTPWEADTDPLMARPSPFSVQPSLHCTELNGSLP